MREPLLLFLLVGLVLFALWRVVNPVAATGGPTNRIVLTDDDLRQMSLVWIAQGRPPPTPQQMQSLIEDQSSRGSTLSRSTGARPRQG